jgi:acyl-coenzyme A synthetase/AMP-(fatty) acid ligase
VVETLDIAAAVATHVARRPGATALAWQGDAVTYRGLDELAAGAGAGIRDLGLAPGEPLGAALTKGPAAVALVLACLRERRPVLLVPPDLPPATRTALWARAGCRCGLPHGDPTAPEAVPAGPATAARPTSGAGDRPALLLTTSGTTGTPKVVPLGGAAVGRFVAWAVDRFGLAPDTAVLSHAPLHFDLSLLDVWATLAAGGQVVLVEPGREVRPDHLHRLLSAHRVEVVQAVPMIYRLLLGSPAAAGAPLGHLRHVIFTGDHLSPADALRLRDLAPAARLHNVYGCTETNDSFAHELGDDPFDGARGGVLPIGRPLPGVSAVIVGPDGAALGGAGEGELWVSTPFQTTGYAGDGGPQPFAPRPETPERPWFRTGDLVARDANGRIVLTGRRDHQVKVRGIRVDTAQVEQLLRTHPHVVDAAVVAVPDPVGGHALHAVAQRVAGSGLDSLALRSYCAGRLAAAAIPSSIRLGDLPLPRTSTGKPDRRSIAAALATS